jgi:hypothetical protein
VLLLVAKARPAQAVCLIPVNFEGCADNLRSGGGCKIFAITIDITDCCNSALDQTKTIRLHETPGETETFCFCENLEPGDHYDVSVVCIDCIPDFAPPINGDRDLTFGINRKDKIISEKPGQFFADNVIGDLSANVVPEPSTWVALSLGLALLLWRKSLS